MRQTALLGLLLLALPAAAQGALAGRWETRPDRLRGPETPVRVSLAFETDSTARLGTVFDVRYRVATDGLGNRVVAFDGEPADNAGAFALSGDDLMLEVRKGQPVTFFRRAGVAAADSLVGRWAATDVDGWPVVPKPGEQALTEIAFAPDGGGALTSVLVLAYHLDGDAVVFPDGELETRNPYRLSGDTLVLTETDGSTTAYRRAP